MSLPVICKFVSWVDGNKSDSTGLDELRLQLFKTSSNNNFRELPPSEEGLELHIRRSSYQSGWIWGNSTGQEQVPPRQSKVLAGLYKRKACLYIGQNFRDNQF